MTTLDDLKAPWTAQLRQHDLLPGNVQDELARVRRDLRMRDLWMVLPLLAVAAGSVFFNVWARPGVPMPTLLANAALVTFTVIVIVVLWRGRHGGGGDDRTLRAQLDREITRLARQARLLRSVAVWFLLPMAVVEVAGSLAGLHERTGSFVPTGSLWLLYAASLVLAAVTYGLCRREANRRFAPLRASLVALRQDLLADPAQ